MIGPLVRVEYCRQSLRGRLLTISRIPGNGYHILMICLAGALGGPVVFIDFVQVPYGLPLLGAETWFFFMVIMIGITFIFTGLFAPLGIFLI